MVCSVPLRAIVLSDRVAQLIATNEIDIAVAVDISCNYIRFKTIEVVRVFADAAPVGPPKRGAVPKQVGYNH